MLHCNSRTTKMWKRLEIITVKCPVSVFRATSQHLRFHNRLLSFLVQLEICSSWRVPVWTTTLKRYFPFNCSARSPFCARTFLYQMHTSPDQANWQLCRDNGLKPPLTRHALHPWSFINALSKSHGVYMNWILRCCLSCSASVTEILCYIASCVTWYIRYVTYIFKSHRSWIQVATHT